MSFKSRLPNRKNSKSTFYRRIGKRDAEALSSTDSDTNPCGNRDTKRKCTASERVESDSNPYGNRDTKRKCMASERVEDEITIVDRPMLSDTTCCTSSSESSEDSYSDCVSESSIEDAPSEFQNTLGSGTSLHVPDDSSNKSHTISVRESLGKWAIEHNVPNTTVGALLAILKPVNPTLPKDPRTLLEVKPVSGIVPMGEGEYLYFGLTENLCRMCELNPKLQLVIAFLQY